MAYNFNNYLIENCKISADIDGNPDNINLLGSEGNLQNAVMRNCEVCGGIYNNIIASAYGHYRIEGCRFNLLSLGCVMELHSAIDAAIEGCEFQIQNLTRAVAEGSDISKCEFRNNKIAVANYSGLYTMFSFRNMSDFNICGNDIRVDSSLLGVKVFSNTHLQSQFCFSNNKIKIAGNPADDPDVLVWIGILSQTDTPFPHLSEAEFMSNEFAVSRTPVQLRIDEYSASRDIEFPGGRSGEAMLESVLAANTKFGFNKITVEA